MKAVTALVSVTTLYTGSITNTSGLNSLSRAASVFAPCRVSNFKLDSYHNHRFSCGVPFKCLVIFIILLCSCGGGTSSCRYITLDCVVWKPNQSSPRDKLKHNCIANMDFSDLYLPNRIMKMTRHLNGTPHE